MYTGKIIKIGGVELTEQEAQQLFNDRRFIVTYGKIYDITYRNGSFHGKEIYKSKGMTRRGRYFALTADQINNLVGFKLA